MFLRAIDCYIKLEVLKIRSAVISKNSFELLSSKGHQIKIIDFHETNIRGIEKLLMKNNNLLELNLNSKDFRINVGNILKY